MTSSNTRDADRSLVGETPDTAAPGFLIIPTQVRLQESDALEAKREQARQWMLANGITEVRPVINVRGRP